jgi:hypothetical protein
MPQIFHKAANPISKILLVGLPILFGGTGVGLAAFFRSSYATGVDEVVPQPVAFSHAHHVSQLGIDCRYCHTSVENSGFANVPPTKICMNCHQQMWTGADLLGPVRESYKTDTPIAWNRVHNVPHYAYFNHSIHVAKGVGCQSCHGRIDEMNLTRQTKTLLMEWCVNCHREPERNLRPKSEVTSMTWDVKNPGVWKHEDFGFYGTSPDGTPHPAAAGLVGKPRPNNQMELGRQLKDIYGIRDGITMSSCSMCHR